MKENINIYRCNKCGKIIEIINNTNVDTVCCHEEMKLLTANTTEAATEKHIPVVKRIDDNKIEVNIGSVDHPMTAEHYIEWIYVVDGSNIIRVNLTPSDKPSAIINVNNKNVVVYAYCNLHGLWKSSLE